MSRPWKLASAGVLLALAALIAAIHFTIAREVGWPVLLGAVAGPRARPLTLRTFERTPARLERGRYLVEALLRCFDCHSEVDWKSPGAPALPGTMGAGQVFHLEGAPFQIIASNITPDPETGAGNWTDDMFARAIREGIGHDGRPLVPVMLYENFRLLSDEDLAAVVVYVRSIPPIRRLLPRTKAPFPWNFVVRGVPEPVTEPVASPDAADRVKYGAYLAKIGECESCHSTRIEGGGLFAGGNVFWTPFGQVATANITPDPSGIAHYDEAMFILTLRTGRAGGVRPFSPAMRWVYLRNLTDEDMKAIFAYLRTVKPVRHRVDNTEPPAYCRLCGNTHGYGDRN